MAFSATLQWDVRSSASDLNGGGFDPASSGTDYSQQDAAQVTYTDLVIGSTNTQLTSAANPFTAAHVGNIINVTSGTGFTTQRVQIVSVAAGVATCDKACGTASSTGGNGKLGGALQTVAKAFSLVTGAYQLGIIWIKAGTYATTVPYTIDSNSGCAVIGYNTTHGDITPTNGLARPLLTCATNGVHLIDLNGSAVDSIIQFQNISMSHTAPTRSFGINAVGARTHLLLWNCLMDGFSTALQGDFAANWNWNGLILIGTEIKNSTGAGVFNSGSGTGNILTVYGCYIHNNGSHGINWTGGTCIINSSIVTANAGSGIVFGGTGAAHIWALSNTFANNSSGSGLDASAGLSGVGGGDMPVMLINNIFYGNSAYGVKLPVVSTNMPATFPNFNNAYGANGTAPRLNFSAGFNDAALTANPFTNSAAGDYSLNSTVGGGAACKGAGYQYPS